MVSEAGNTARQLGLAPHPEGGWFRRTWTSPATVDGSRAAATMIHFLLHPGESSAWHVVDADEVWLWHGPGPLRLQLGGSGAKPAVTEPPLLLGIPIGTDPSEGVLLPIGLTQGVLDSKEGGRNLANVYAVQAVVPAHTWQCTEPVEDEVLLSCLVSPGFTDEGFRLST